MGKERLNKEGRERLARLIEGQGWEAVNEEVRRLKPKKGSRGPAPGNSSRMFDAAERSYQLIEWERLQGATSVLRASKVVAGKYGIPAGTARRHHRWMVRIRTPWELRFTRKWMRLHGPRSRTNTRDGGNGWFDWRDLSVTPDKTAQ